MQVNHLHTSFIDNDFQTNLLAAVTAASVAGSSFYVTALAASYAGTIPTTPQQAILGIGGDDDFLVAVNGNTPFSIAFTTPLRYPAGSNVVWELPAGGVGAIGIVTMTGYYIKDTNL